MTEPYEWVPPEMMEALRECLRESGAKGQRRTNLRLDVADIEGPLGDLLRTVSVMHDDWILACDAGATTDAESRRMEQITDAAVECATWLRGSS